MKSFSHYSASHSFKRKPILLAGDRAGHFLLWLVGCSIAAPMVVAIIYKAFG